MSSPDDGGKKCGRGRAMSVVAEAAELPGGNGFTFTTPLLHCRFVEYRTLTHPPQLTPTSTFTSDLGLDSLDAVEVVMAIEEEFAIEIPDAEADAINTVDQGEYLMAQRHG